MSIRFSLSFYPYYNPAYRVYHFNHTGSISIHFLGITGSHFFSFELFLSGWFFTAHGFYQFSLLQVSEAFKEKNL